MTVYILEDILRKSPEDLTQEEIAHLKSEIGNLTDQQIEKFQSVLKTDEDNGEEAEQTTPAGDETQTAEPAQPAAPANVFEGVNIDDVTKVSDPDQMELEGHFAHIITQEDLDLNPELVGQVEVGERVFIPEADGSQDNGEETA